MNELRQFALQEKLFCYFPGSDKNSDPASRLKMWLTEANNRDVIGVITSQVTQVLTKSWGALGLINLLSTNRPLEQDLTLFNTLNVYRCGVASPQEHHTNLSVPPLQLHSPIFPNWASRAGCRQWRPPCAGPGRQRQKYGALDLYSSVSENHTHHLVGAAQRRPAVL